MIVAIEAEVYLVEPTFVHLKTPNGLIYQLNISIHTSSNISKGQKITLHATQIIREDAHILFGFYDPGEKEMFDRLIKINGVGPSTALAICSTFTPSSFLNVVQSSDVNSLKMVPGIGPKSAKRILVELGEFSLSSTESDQNKDLNDAKKALESLGFKPQSINEALKKCTSSQTSDIVKEALKILSKGR